MGQKIVVCIMGQNCEKFIGMCLESVKDADAIVYCDGGSKAEFFMKFQSLPIRKEIDNKFKLIQNKYDQEDKGMNGKQRNFYLDYVKKNYPNWWCLVIDPDEVVEDFSKIKEFIQLANKDKLYSIKMRHLIGDLGHEDATQPIHFVPHRLFYISNDLFYPEIEHPVLQSEKDKETIPVQVTTIWHLSYISGIWNIKKKYENHMKKSTIHSEKYLNNWYRAHLFGQYPKSQVNLLELPEILLKEFGVEKDELYFMNRGLELKHFLMCKNWMDYFGLSDKKSILDIGAGLGHYGFVLQEFMDCNYLGIEKSKWAVKNCPYKDLDIRQMDITKGIALPDSNYDLVLCLDILEHLEEEKLDFVLDALSRTGKYFIFSIPFLGDPNLMMDSTHKIFKPKKWWIEKLNKHFKIEDAPSNWLFNHQILIGEKR
ncbi:MAG: methyltransferase [Candidatus Heimdallarchaeaceae archaeon]